MPPRLTRPPIRRAATPARTTPDIVRRAQAAERPAAMAKCAPQLVPRNALRVTLTRPTVPVGLPLPRLPVQPAPSRLGGWRGPNPYVDFARHFTDAGGIRLTFKVRDSQLWRTVIRVILWLLLMAAAYWYALRASPYPMVPQVCWRVRTCPDSLVATHVLVNSLAIGLLAGVSAWILFVQDQTLTTIEIRPDCMIIDDSDVFWRERMDLGWPQIVRGEADSFVLRGVYGTREVDYVTLHAFDEKDRAIQVLGAQLHFAMQQLWQGPAG